ncbi:hypothetical protein PWT90_06880 [Aphanocladium album]|nr:hypothetical protein PWT90_06880 [Aphanocladium album]
MVSNLKAYLEALPPEPVMASLAIIFASVIASVIAVCLRVSTTSELPCLNPKGVFEFSDTRTKAIWMKDGANMLRSWFKKNPDKPVLVNADTGPMTILPSSMANEIRNDPRLGFMEVVQETFHTYLHGFEPFRLGKSDGLIQDIIRKDLTKQLVKVTSALADETSLALRELLTDDPEWHEVHVRETILRLVARISSRVFLGTELCRNPDWLRITKEYAVAAFSAARELRQYPLIVRPFANRLLKSCRTAQAMIKEARTVIYPVIDKRMEARQAAAAAGETYIDSYDAMDWFARSNDQKYFEAAMFQLALSAAAIHTTTDLLSETLFRIAKQPGVIPALRKEILEIYKSDGWEKTALYKMQLLDSTIKETQRMKPIALVSMRRKVKESFTLSNGVHLTKGQRVSITSTNLRDPSNHKNPDTWDPYRFVRMRDDPVRHNAAHLVSTAPEHMAFGHGQHACPGRFFAANEIKVALLGIVIKYDFELPENVDPQVYENGVSLVSDPMASLRFRRRQAEVNLDLE